MTIEVKDKPAVKEWLEQNAKRMDEMGHPDGWEIPLSKLDEFNEFIQTITAKQNSKGEIGHIASHDHSRRLRYILAASQRNSSAIGLCRTPGWS